MLNFLKKKKKKKNKSKNAINTTVEKVGKREERIQSVMKKTGWTRTETLAKMREAKEKLGITYGDYDRHDFHLLSYEEQEKKAAGILSNRQQREDCIAQTMSLTGWDREQAKEHLSLARNLTDIKYKEYISWKFYNVPEDEMVSEYERHMRKKAKRAKIHERYKNQVKAATGWDDELILSKMKKAWDENGISAEKFAVYKFWEVPEEEWCTYFSKGDVNALREKYNKDPEVIKTFMNKDLFCEKYDKYLGRPWLSTKDLSFENFVEKFGTSGKVIYKPTKRSGGKGIHVYRFKKDTVKKVYDKIAALPPGLLEGFFKQHPDMQQYSVRSVNTLRVATIVSYDNIPGTVNGIANIVFVGLRMGCGTRYVDNLHSGGIMADIDVDTGIIVTDGVDFANNVYTEHPDTGKTIKGFKIPYFEEVKQLVHEVADGIEGYYGWDIAIGENGPVIIEVNTNAGPAPLQAPYVPMKKGMRYRIEKYL